MKKILLGTSILVFGVSTFASLTYSDNHIAHLKTCSPYSEVYVAKIPTQDPNTPLLHLRSTEKVLGWNNGKCKTSSIVYSDDMHMEILTTDCAFSKTQLNSIVSKMEQVNAGNSQLGKALQDEITQYVQDGITCKVNNLLEIMQ